MNGSSEATHGVIMMDEDTTTYTARNDKPLSQYTHEELHDAYKKALMDERDRRIQTQDNLYTYTKKMEKLQKQLFEKDQALVHIANENKSLQEKLIFMEELQEQTAPQTKNKRFTMDTRRTSSSEFDIPVGSYSGSSPQESPRKSMDKKSLSNLLATLPNFGRIENENSKLQLEKIQMLEVRLKERDEKLIESQTLASSRDQHIEDLKAKLQVAREKIEHFTSENKRLSHTSDSLEKEKNDLTNQLQIAQKQAETFEKRVKELEIELSNAKEQITQLSESNTKNEETIAQMSDKLVRLKGEMSIVKLQLRKFNVRRVRSYLPSVEAVLVLHKNPQNGLLMFSMEVGGVPHLVVPMTAILDVQADEVHVKRFHIRFPNNKTETFESNELKEIMTTLKEFQGAAIDENGVHTPVGTTSSPTKSFRLRNARK